jgi:hypothetical protein
VPLTQDLLILRAGRRLTEVPPPVVAKAEELGRDAGKAAAALLAGRAGYVRVQQRGAASRARTASRVRCRSRSSNPVSPSGTVASSRALACTSGRSITVSTRRARLPEGTCPGAVLTYCDMTTSPDGELVPARRRLAEIHHRYGPGHLVSRSSQRATPMILRAVEQVHRRAARTA